VVQALYDLFRDAALAEVDLRLIPWVSTAGNPQAIRNIAMHYLDAARKCYDVAVRFRSQQRDALPALSRVTAELAAFGEDPGAVYYAVYVVARGEKP